MPLTPLDVQGFSGPDSFTLSWQRPGDASIVGYQIQYGFQSALYTNGLYANTINVGNVLTFTIFPLPTNQNVYAVVESYDNATPANLSAPSPEIARLFPITAPTVLVGVPDAVAPQGKTNDLFWVNPVDPNLQGMIVSRALAATSTSGASPATTVASGQTLTLNLNGDGAQTIFLATNTTGDSIAADIQAKVQALIASDGAKQVVYDIFQAQFVNGLYVLTAGSTFVGVNSVVVSGGTAAPALKLGLANGGVEAAGTAQSQVDLALAPLIQFQDVVSANGKTYDYAIQSYDFSNPPQVSSPARTSVFSQVILGSSPPSAPKNLKGYDNAVSILLQWDQNPEPNVASYQINWATSLSALQNTPNTINVGFGNTYVLSGFLPTDKVYVQVLAVDDGINPDGSHRSPFLSAPSNTFSRILSQAGITTVFALQTDLSNNVTLIWNNVPAADNFLVELDGVPTFDSPNLISLTRFLSVEDLVYISQQTSLPAQRSSPVSWYWRVRPTFPGGIHGLYNTQVQEFVPLNGVLPFILGSTVSTLQTGLTFIEESLQIKNGNTTFVNGRDYKFIAPNQVVRTSSSTIPDGMTVQIISEFEQILKVGVNRRAETRDRMMATLDPLYYDKTSKTSNIFKWFQAISRGALADYVIANRQLIQGNVISSTVPSELYSRYGGMVNLTAGQIPMPDAYAAIKALYPAFLTAGTQEAVNDVCVGLTGRGCIIQQGGTGAGAGWILYGQQPIVGFPDFVLGDFPGLSLPINTFDVTLLDYDDVFNWNITIANSARGLDTTLIRGNSGLSDFVGQANLVPGSVQLIDSNLNSINPSRYSIDFVKGVINWVSGQAPASGSSYTVIGGYYITDLIKAVLNEILPAHVNPVYTFQIQGLAQTLGLMVWDVSFWDSANWGG